MSERDGGAAFPYLMEHCQRVNETEMHGGLTKREWYAGMALMGYRANPKTWDKSPEDIAKYCREDADAQLRAGREGGDDAHE